MAKLPLPRNRRVPAESMEDKGGLWDWLSGWLPARGHVGIHPINEGTTYGIPAAWRCVTFISNAVANTGPPVAHQGRAHPGTSHGYDDNIPMENQPNIVTAPWPMMTAQEYWSGVTASLLLHGNFIGIPRDFDPDTGYPRQVIPLNPMDVEFKIEGGLPMYKYGDFEWEWGEVLHIRGFTPPGKLWGVGVIQAHRIGLSEAVDHQDYGMNIYGGSAVPPWVVGVDNPDLTEAQAEALQQRMATIREQGSKLPAVIPSTMNISTLAFSPADAQFLEAKRANATEIAWMFGMDPADLGVSTPGASLTYANIGERSVERLVHTVGPWIRRIEQAWSAYLLPGNQHCHFQVSELLRLDPTSLMAHLRDGYDSGLLTYNECRKRLAMPCVDEPWADEPFGKPDSQKPEAFGLPPVESTQEGMSDDSDDGTDDSTDD